MNSQFSAGFEFLTAVAMKTPTDILGGSSAETSMNFNGVQGVRSQKIELFTFSLSVLHHWIVMYT
jgi:hypothetical protein